MDNPSRTTREGFTLVEVLSVIAIIAILIGILIPVLHSARRRSFEAVDTSNLRQIGQGLAIYNADAADPVYSSKLLVNSGICPPQIFASPLDRLSIGAANDTRRIAGTPVTSFKDSYVSVSDEHGPGAVRTLVASPGGGTFVSLCEGHVGPDGVDEGPRTYRGSYLRLLADGAVQRRERIWKQQPGTTDPRQVFESSFWRFTDDQDSLKRGSSPF